jgi:hypothetical protein
MCSEEFLLSAEKPRGFDSELFSAEKQKPILNTS